MAEQENKERKLLYGEENDGDSILWIAYFVRIILFLVPVGAVLWLVKLLVNNEVTQLSCLVCLLVIIVGTLFAVLVGKALKELGWLVEENARLKSAVSYLCQTHGIELRDFDEAPAEDIPGTGSDGFETMRIEEDGVHFRKVGDKVKCPFCDREQPAGGEACENCGQRFFFED